MSVWLSPSRQIAWLILLSATLLAWRALAFSLSGATLYVDEAQYWVWSQQLDWGYFSKPPGIAALIQLSTRLFGDTPLGVKALSMVCYPLAAFACWLIAHRLYDSATALQATAIVLSLPIFSWLGLFASTDAPLTLFWLLGLWCYLRALERNGWLDWLALGAICGLGLLTKYTMAIFIGSLFAHLFCFHRQRLKDARPWIGGLLSLTMLAPNLAWNIAHNFPTLRHTADITLNRQGAGGLMALGEFWGTQWLAFGPVFGCLAAAKLFRLHRHWRQAPARLLLWFSLPLWLVVSAQALQGNANANWAAPAFGPMAILLAAWFAQHARQKLLWTGLAGNLIVVGALYHAPDLLAAARMPHQARLNPYIRAMGWDQIGQQLRPHLEPRRNAVLLADNRTLLAHMAYALRDLQPEIASWNPDGRTSDHFKLTTDLSKYAGADAVLISEQTPSPEITQRFTNIEKLGDLETPLDAFSKRHIEVYLLHEFKGY